MSYNPDNPELPDGSDPTALPSEAKEARPYRDHGKRAFANLIQPTDLTVSKPKVPIVTSQSKNPSRELAKMFDMAIAVAALMEDEFEFSELYHTYIDMFRNDPDPKIRMAAGDRIVKMVKDALVAGGAVSKVVESVQIRSPDGTTAERSVINRSIIRSFQEDNSHARPEPEVIPAALVQAVGEVGNEAVLDPNAPAIADPTVAPVDDSFGGSGGAGDGDGPSGIDPPVGVPGDPVVRPDPAQ